MDDTAIQHLRSAMKYNALLLRKQTCDNPVLLICYISDFLSLTWSLVLSSVKLCNPTLYTASVTIFTYSFLLHLCLYCRVLYNLFDTSQFHPIGISPDFGDYAYDSYQQACLPTNKMPLLHQVNRFIIIIFNIRFDIILFFI